MWTIILIKQSLHYSLNGPARILSWNVLNAHCMQRRGCTKWDRRVSLNTDINRCKVQTTETVLYVLTQRRPSSGYHSPVNPNFLVVCGLPQISSVHCRLTTACCCCRTHVTNEFCCRQTFQNRPTQRCVITRIQTTARVQQMGIPGHGCHNSRRESRLWTGGA